MITVILSAIHGFSTNTDFQPTVMYIGTLLLDIMIIKAVFGIE